MNLTNSQKKAVTECGKNIIVSAGAGSGKTAVLTRRVVNNIKHRDIKIDEMLILTFTNASALEMKTRIKNSLIDDKENYELVDNSYITTFDSFCLSVVKRYSYLLNLPNDISANPYNGLIIESEAKNILRDIFSKHYQKSDLDFINLVNLYSLKDDKVLFNGIFSIYQDIDKKANSKALIDKCLNTQKSDITNYIYQAINKYIKELKSNIINKVVDFSTNCLESQEHCKVIEEFLKMTESNDLLAAINYFLTNLPRKNKICSETYSKDQRLLKDELKTNLTFLEKVSTKELISQEIDFEYHNQIVIAGILKELKARLEEVQTKNHLYNFNDIEMLATKVIEENENVRKELMDSFKEIMIDEYQDTNDIQENLINLIANNNVYQVGDIKQSIYRFRNANPRLFRNKYDDYSKGNGGTKIDLLENFRSRKEIINDIVNPIFSSIMTLDVGDADYKKAHKMIYGNHNYDLTKENYDLDLIDFSKLSEIKKDKKDSSAFSRKLRFFNDVELEAIYICQDIKKKLAKRFQVLENQHFRDVKYSDFTIMAAKGSNFFRIKKIFEDYKIPLIIKKDEDIKENTEFDAISSIFSLLYYIINKEEPNRVVKQKYYLASILRSYLYEKSDEYIYRVIKNDFYKDEVYKQACSLAKKTELLSPKVFFEEVVEVFGLIDKACNITDIDSLIAKIDYLKSLAATLSNTSYNNLDFIKIIIDIKKNNLKLEYSTVEKNETAVTLTTIHKSKGLQYNICYLIDIDSRVNMDDTKKTFTFYDNLIMTPLSLESDNNNTIMHYIYKSELKKATISEMVRLYYVAFTRAKEKLIVLTTRSNNKNTFSSMLDEVNFSFNQIMVDEDFEVPFTKHQRMKIPTLTNQKVIVTENNIDYNLLENKNYSKNINKIITKKEQEILNFGTTLHECLEILDFHNPKEIDNFLISDFLKEKLRAFVNIDIIKNLTSEKIYKEYEFIDDDTVGIIDLMIESSEEIKIIDYKTSNIDDDSYKLQLTGYKNYLSKITNKNIKTYLYSILNETLKEIII